MTQWHTGPRVWLPPLVLPDPKKTSTTPGGGNDPYGDDKGGSNPARKLKFDPSRDPLPAIYGDVRNVGGGVNFWKVKNGFLHISWLISWGELNSISNIKIDGVPIAGIAQSYEVKLGATTQAVSTILSAVEPNWLSSRPGQAYIVGKFQATIFNIELDFTKLTCDVQGIKVRDPRLDATLVNRYYNANPALCIADFMTDEHYGGGILVADMDWATSITEAANDCDVVVGGNAVSRIPVTSNGSYEDPTPPSVTISGGAGITTATAEAVMAANKTTGKWEVAYVQIITPGSGYSSVPSVTLGYRAGATPAVLGAAQLGAKRFALNIHLGNQREFPEVLDNLKAHAMLMTPYNNGKHMIVMIKSQAVCGIVLTDTGTEANILASDTTQWRQKSRAECPTKVRIRYTAEHVALEGFAEDEHPDIRLGTVDSIEKVWELFGVTTYDQAKRLAIQYRNLSAMDKEYAFMINMIASKLLPGNVVQVTSTEVNVSNQQMIITSLEPSPTDGSWIVYMVIYDSAVFSDAPYNGNVIAPPATVSPYDRPPEVMPGNASTSYKTTYWDEPVFRSGLRVTDPLTAISGSNITSVPGEWQKILEDGTETVEAVNWNLAGDSWLRWDFGAAVTPREVRIATVNSVDLWTSNFLTIEYSDDNVAWTAPTTENQTPGSGVTTKITRYSWTSAADAHRYWRIRKGGSAIAANVQFAEIVWYERTGNIYPHVKEYRVYTLNGSTRELYAVFPGSIRPTITNPMDVKPIQTRTTSIDTSTSTSETVIVTVVSYAGVESDGIKATKFAAGAAANAIPYYVVQDQTNLTIAGNTAALLVSTVATYHRLIAGAVAATWSLFGIESPAAGGAGSGGRQVILKNETGFIMNILGESASDVAVNRIDVSQFGATANDLMVLPGGTVTLCYDETIQRWAVTAHADAGSLSNYVRGFTNAASETSATLVPADSTSLIRAIGAGTWTLHGIGGAKWPGRRLSIFSRIAGIITIIEQSGTETDVLSRIQTNVGTTLKFTSPCQLEFVYDAVPQWWTLTNVLAKETIMPLNPPISMVPATATGGSTIGAAVTNATVQTQGAMINRTVTTSNLDVDVVNISGRGAVKFLSWGTGSAGVNAILTLVVDGITLINAANAANTTANNGWTSAAVGTIGFSKEGSNFEHWANLDANGLQFKSTLVIKLRSATDLNTAACIYSYETY